MTEMVPIMVDGVIKEVPADTVFTPKAPEEPRVPEFVTRAQAKIALARAGLYEQAEALINAIPGNEGLEARIWWNSADTFRRSHPLIAAIGPQLDPPQSEEDIDQLFLDAEQVQ